MEALLRLPRRATYADYLAVEQTSERRHEFFDGVIVAIAGGSDEHNAIAGRFAKLLGNRETGTDGSMICGAPEHPPHDPQATINPTLVLEVMSPSSEGDDDGDKRSDFQSLASLQAYVLVAQDQRFIKVYRRTGGAWHITTHEDGDTFELPTLSGPITVADVYDGILDAPGRSLLRAEA